MEKGSRFKIDLVIYCFFFLFALAMIRPALNLGLGDIGEVGPGLLPFIALACVSSMSAVLIISTLVRSTRGGPTPSYGKVDPATILRVSEILLSLIVWPFLVGRIGYILATFLVCLGMAKAVGYKGWVGPVLLSAGFAFSIWVLFGLMFYIDLPAGFFL